ncbi:MULTISPECIES: hypothetical protein [Micromonosporaceae]|uniref:hypothetical protein n=1 Tax=Micromonosporaceae TaxID=28056 RepID=UPI00248C5CE9|nr:MULTISPECIES: hypothetical protein [unclassified Solwaraspora]WBB95597.1 hypothetical protein O7553_19725 [Solwaraspora sp. WMMA2059]WBC20498.1 hypothetical protein O7543_27640 [Solwaraspora sp. WMMA2080]
MSTQQESLSPEQTNSKIGLVAVLSVLGLATLIVNFLLAGAVGAAGAVASIWGLRTDRRHRTAYQVLLGISLLTVAFSLLMSAFLLSVDRPEPSVTVVPKP